MADSLKDNLLNAVVTADDLMRALDAVNDLDAEDRADYTARCLAILGAFGRLGEPGSGREFTDEDHREINKITAIQLRLESIAHLTTNPKFKAWSLDVTGEDGDHVLLREDVLSAAAQTPLRETDGNTHFDPDEFFQILLEISDEAGQA